MLIEKPADGAQDQPKVETPEKSLFEKLVDATPLILKKEEVKAEDAPKEEQKAPEVDPKLSLLEEKLKTVVKSVEEDIASKKALLPNTKDEAKKLEIERAIFEKEKQLAELKADLTQPEVPQIGELNEFFKTSGIAEGSEAYTLSQQMLKHEGASDLIKLYLKVASAVVKSLKVEKQPEEIKKLNDVKNGNQPVFSDDSFVGQIIKDLNK